MLSEALERCESFPELFKNSTAENYQHLKYLEKKEEQIRDGQKLFEEMDQRNRDEKYAVGISLAARINAFLRNEHGYDAVRYASISLPSCWSKLRIYITYGRSLSEEVLEEIRQFLVEEFKTSELKVDNYINVELGEDK